MFSNTFKVINNIRIELCDIAAQSAHYRGWDNEFSRKEIKNIVFNEADVLRKKRETVILDDLESVVEHEQATRGVYVYYRVDYEALFGYWFDPEDASRLKIIRFTDGSIINADEVYLHDLTEDAHYNYVNKKLLLLKLAGEDISQKKDTLQ